MKCYFGIALIALVMLCAAQSVPLQGKKGGVCNQDCSDDVSGPYCMEKQGKLLILQFGKCQVDSMECLRGNVGVQLERLSFIKCPKCAKRCFPPKDGSKPPYVCDSKKGIHDSECMFGNAKCIDDSLRKVRCPECVKRCFPPKDGSKPPTVCDSKGGIHDSVCMFRNAKCIDDSLQRVRCRPGKPRKPST